MIMTLLGQVKQYRRDSILTPVFTALEVLMEVLIPFITASLIDQGIEAGNMTKVLQYGGLMHLGHHRIADRPGNRSR